MDAFRALVEEFLRMPLEVLQGMEQEDLDKLRQIRVRRRRFDNAIKDFITAVLTTELIRAGEDAIRINLIKIAHLLEEVIIHRALTETDEEFDRYSAARIKPLASQVVHLLRSTASEFSTTEQSRAAWLGYHSEYRGEFQVVFEAIVQTARMERQGSSADQLRNP